jgi:hypothetical protein
VRRVRNAVVTKCETLCITKNNTCNIGSHVTCDTTDTRSSTSSPPQRTLYDKTLSNIPHHAKIRSASNVLASYALSSHFFPTRPCPSVQGQRSASHLSFTLPFTDRFLVPQGSDCSPIANPEGITSQVLILVPPRPLNGG